MALPARRVPDEMTPAMMQALMLKVEQLIGLMGSPVFEPQINVQLGEMRVTPQIAPPIVNVDAATAPNVQVDVEAPEVHVDVAPAEVHADVAVHPSITVQWAPKSAVTDVKRDGNGFIQSTTTRYEY